MNYSRQAKAPTGSQLCIKTLFLPLPFFKASYNAKRNDRQAKAPTGSRLCIKSLFLTLPFANFSHNTNAMIGRRMCPPAPIFR